MKANISNIQKIYSEIPSTWEFEGVTYQGYQHFEHLHFEHGWRDVVLPTFNAETHKLSNEYILVNDIVTKEVIDLTPEEIIHQLQQRALEIDLEYTEKISKLMSKHNDKFIEGLITNNLYVIPQDVINERERLKNECNQLILDLGINDFSYRQSNLQLKK